MTLESLLKQLELDERIEQSILHQFSKNRNKIQEISISAYDLKESSFLLCNRKPLTRLVVVINLLLKIYDEYKEQNISDEIIINTFKDVSLRSNLYLKRTGKVGITKDDVTWFRHIMNINIFKIGSLQFQPFEMIYLDEELLEEPYMSFSIEQKKLLPAGTPVINCHIQYGANIEIESVNESLKNALSFFTMRYPSINYKAFVCYSWLLYPPMRQHLKEKSKIKLFAEKFNVIGHCNDVEQARECLFADNKEKMSSLQKEFVKHKKYFGFACGIIAIQ
ncbi:MAG: DUF5596 domain-containing protein [Erysipelotrichaceae bacterium]|nr:DUF5596 domain-containing protein [Erysipelotrichaceae bacterium]